MELKLWVIGITDNKVYHELTSYSTDIENWIEPRFVPHITIHRDAAGAKCRIAKIPLEWYGKEAKIW